MKYDIPELKRLYESKIDFLHPDEKCHLFFRRHGICLLFSIAKDWLPAFLLFFLLLLFSLWIFEQNWTHSSASLVVFLGMTLFSLFLIHWLFLKIIGYFLGFMMVTDRRIIEFHKTVFLREEMKEIPFHQITNIHHEKNGFVQNMLGYGSLEIHSNVRDPVCMRFVPHSEEKYAKISASYGKEVKLPEKKEKRRKRERFIYAPLRRLFRTIAKR